MIPKASLQPLLLFSAGGLRFGVFLAEIARLVVEDRLAAVPFAHPSMAGLLLEPSAGLVPVFDVGCLLDPLRTPRRGAGATIALFPTEKGTIGLRIDGIEGTVEDYQPVGAEEGARMLEALPDGIRRLVGGVAVRAEAPLYFFSPEGLLVELGLLSPGGPVSSRHGVS